MYHVELSIEEARRERALEIADDFLGSHSANEKRALKLAKQIETYLEKGELPDLEEDIKPSPDIVTIRQY